MTIPYNNTSPIFFFHGKESGPHGSKYHALSAAFTTVISPDFRNMNLEQRLQHAEETTREFSNIALVGSSMGGLVAAMLYDRFPERFAGYILMAPALHWEGAQTISNIPENAHVIHGTNDDIVPLEAVQRFCEDKTLPITIVDDNHRLHKSQSLMVDYTYILITSRS